MNVLVTGGAGLLGSYVMAVLAVEGHEGFAYDLEGPGPELLGVAPALSTRLRRGNIEDLDRLMEVCRSDRIEVIVHAAARLGFQTSLGDPLGFYQTNVMGTVNVCEAARRLGIRKIVSISSNAVYHPRSGLSLVETDPPFSVVHGNPAGHYGTSKMASEAIGMAYAEFHGIDFVALRTTAVYGFGMRSPLHLKPMVEDAINGVPTRFATGGRMKRDYTHVLDCSRAVLLAVDAPSLPAGSQRILNVAAGHVYTPAEIADIVRQVVPGADIEIGMDLTTLELENVKMRAPLDITMARRTLVWTPEWTIEAGIRQYAERYRRYIKG